MKDTYCIHLDFHTSEEIEGVGRDFSEEKFTEALKLSGVDSITLFAKCHHGNFYYYSDKFFTHPHLEKPLLDLQLEACEKAGVSAKIYICAGLDEHSAQEHPEWLTVAENGTPQNMLEPHFHRICFNTPYLDLLVAQTEEVTKKYMPDGLFFDIVGDAPCCCKYCVAEMKKKGYDYRKHEDVMKQAQETYRRMTDAIIAAARAIKPDVLVFFNAGNFPVGRKDRIDVNSQLEVESLPTGSWGYDHFPISMSYIRRKGKNCIGMTGKFHSTWGEFGGFKYKDALMYEGAQCFAFDAGFSVGDQLHPTGVIDGYTYENIGNANRYVKAREKWRGGEFQPELAVYCADRNKGRDGIGRILFEAKYMFDLIECEEISNKYPLIILASGEHGLNDAEYAALSKYVKNGGKLLACGKAPVYNGNIAFDLGCEIAGEDDRLPTYIRAKYPLSAANGMALAIYTDSREIKLTEGGKLLAEKVRPYFKREGTHFCSHNNIPCNYDTTEPAITEGKDGIYCMSDLFAEYATVGSLNPKQLILPLVEKLLDGKKTVITNLPSSGKAILYRRGESYILHLLYANTIKRGEGIEVIEDLATLADIDISVDVPERITAAITHPEEKTLAVKYENNRAVMHLDKLYCSEIIELQITPLQK